ncbi:MAG: orotate phosphoribosyltransferase [Chloroflexota bacterium]
MTVRAGGNGAPFSDHNQGQGLQAEPEPEERLDNLWLARELFRLGAIRFGEFTVGRTVNSPVYVDLRVLTGSPSTLRYAGRLIQQETSAEQLRRKPSFDPFDIVAGVPYGGLHLATAYSLATNVPMVYARQRTAEQAVTTGAATGEDDVPGSAVGATIQGSFAPGVRVMVIDDLITTGSSLVETVELLDAAGLQVRDAVVLVDREQGGTERLKEHGVRLHSILKLPIMLNLYMSSGMIDEATYRRSIDYLDANRRRRG